MTPQASTSAHAAKGRPATAAAANILSDLPQRLATDLLAGSIGRHVRAGEVLFLAGDPADGLYRIDDGLLKVSISAANGAERILAILGPGDIVGDLAIIDGLPRSASVMALRDSKLLFVSRAHFDAVTERHPDIYKYLVKVLAVRLRNTDMILAAGSFLPLKGRVARALLDLAKAFGKDVGDGRILVHQKISQSDVAAIAGVARENVSRILADWTREKALSRLSGYYCIEKPARIAEQASL